MDAWCMISPAKIILDGTLSIHLCGRYDLKRPGSVRRKLDRARFLYVLPDDLIG